MTLYREQGRAVPVPRPLSSGLRWAIAALTVGSTTVFALWLVQVFRSVIRHGPRPSDGLGFVIIGCFVLHALLAAMWTYRAWSWLPIELRWSPDEPKRITPAKAALFLLVPYFNAYWVFVIARGLTRGLEHMRHASFPYTRAAVPHRLGYVACACTIVFMLVVQVPIVAALPWILFMRRVEAVTREFARSAAGSRHSLDDRANLAVTDVRDHAHSGRFPVPRKNGVRRTG